VKSASFLSETQSKRFKILNRAKVGKIPINSSAQCSISASYRRVKTVILGLDKMKHEAKLRQSLKIMTTAKSYLHLTGQAVRVHPQLTTDPAGK